MKKIDRVIDDVLDIKVRVTNLEEGQIGVSNADWTGSKRGWIASSGVSISSNCHIEVMT